MSTESLVIGGGLVGPVWALMLQQLGLSPHLYEKRPDPRQSHSSAGRSVNLIITSRGINALEKIGLWSTIKPMTTAVLGRMIHHRQGALTYSPYGQGAEECNYAISRSQLNCLLLEAAESRGITLFFAHSVAAVHLARRQVIFGNGVVRGFKQLFAADGGGSQVRTSICQQVQDVQAEVQPFFVEYKELSVSAQKVEQYGMRKNALHLWPRSGEMLMGLPNRDGSLTMTLFMPGQELLALSNQDQLCQHFSQHYADAMALMPDYPTQFFAHPQGSFATVRCTPWCYDDSICLLGDAAHAIVPFFGQGLNCGLEDCVMLYELWHQHRDWREVFKQFNCRRPDSDAIATMAIENYQEMAELAGDEQFLLAKEIEHKLEAAFPQRYRSRYSMALYTLIPYRLVYQMGEIQREILAQLLSTTATIEHLDLNQARQLIAAQLTPFLAQHKISLERFQEGSQQS